MPTDPIESTQLAKLPSFELSNQTVVDVLLEQAGVYPQVTEENLTAADEFVKGGKQILKIVSNERLNFTRQLDDVKKKAMEPEKEIDEALAPIEKQVLDVKRIIHQREEARRRQAEQQERERAQAQQREIARKQTHENNLVSFRSVLERQLRDATAENVDTVERSIRAQNVSADKWEEFAPQAKAIVDDVKALFPSNRRDIELAAAADAKVATQLKEKKEKEAAEARERERAERERISSAAFSATMDVSRDADANAQAVAKASAKVTGVRTVRKFEIIDATAVPDRYWIIDEKKIREEVLAGIPTIPGVRIYNDIASTGK